MKSTNTHSLSLLLAVLLTSFVAGAAQPAAEDFFHQGAQHYLATNELAQAQLVVTNGLKLYPDDPKLKKLWELLNQQQQQQSQNDKNQKDQKDQQSKDQQAKDQQQKEQEKQQEKQNQKPEDKQQQQQDQADKQGKKSEEEKKQGQQASEQKDKGEEQPGEDGQPQSAKAVKMTPQQAVQLLEALKGEERAMPFRPILKTNRHNRVFKDW
jgi:Ca-activated chloride channel family protein